MKRVFPDFAFGSHAIGHRLLLAHLLALDLFLMVIRLVADGNTLSLKLRPTLAVNVFTHWNSWERGISRLFQTMAEV